MESKPTPLVYLEDFGPRLLWGLFPNGIIPVRDGELMVQGDPPRYTIETSALEPEQIQGLAVMLKIRFPEQYPTLEAAIAGVRENGYELLVWHCKGMSLDGGLTIDCGLTILPPLETDGADTTAIATLTIDQIKI